MTKGLAIEFVLSWYCPETSLRGIIGRHPYGYPFNESTVSILGEIPGENIAGTIEVSVDLIVFKEDSAHIYHKNLKLGSFSRSIIIEGYKAQFPIQIISFKAEKEFQPYKHALYKLARDLSNSELSDLFYNTYVLYLNSDSPCLNIINGKNINLEIAEKGVINELMSSVYSDVIRDIAKISSKQGSDFKFSEWYQPKGATKSKPSEMLGSVYYYLICRLALAMNKDNDATYQFICSNPDEAAVYMQSIIFDEV